MFQTCNFELIDADTALILQRMYEELWERKRTAFLLNPNISEEDFALYRAEMHQLDLEVRKASDIRFAFILAGTDARSLAR